MAIKTVLKEQIFASGPTIGGMDYLPIRMTYATVRQVECHDGATRYQIENRSGEKLFLDQDALIGLALVLPSFAVGLVSKEVGRG